MAANRFLALGDSYTIGEGVALESSWPHQLVQQLTRFDIRIQAPEIIAQTGWTTSDLLQALTETAPRGPYTVVTLLIGVNNQYQGRSIQEYATEFEQLLESALKLAGNYQERVAVLAIPDYGLTPFASKDDQSGITYEINRFNEVNRRITVARGIAYIDVKTLSDRYLGDVNYLVNDKLHPNPELYGLWAQLILKEFPLVNEWSRM